MKESILWAPFPFNRGVYEDKVSDGKWKRHIEQIGKRSESSEFPTQEDSSFLLFDSADEAVRRSAPSEQSDDEFLETSDLRF